MNILSHLDFLLCGISWISEILWWSFHEYLVTLGFASLKFLLYKDLTLVFLKLVYHNICLLCQLQPSWLCSTRFQLNFCKSILLNWESGWIFHWDSWILSASIFLFWWDSAFARFIHILVNTPFSKLPFCLIGIHPAITMLILPYSSFLVPLGFSPTSYCHVHAKSMVPSVSPSWGRWWWRRWWWCRWRWCWRWWWWWYKYVPHLHFLSSASASSSALSSRRTIWILGKFLDDWQRQQWSNMYLIIVTI